MSTIERPETTRSVTGWTGKIPTCPYCNLLLTSNEFDFGYDCDGAHEPSWYSAHRECVQPSSEGRYEVVTTQNAVQPPLVHVRRFTTRERAVEVARETRRHNLRSWPCGAQLDIIVRERLVEV